jgi:3'(2'), 5'-bisphosphate nucleotidase
MLNIEILSNSILQVARRAGEAILDVYQSDDFGLETKGDESPLTRADLAAHEVIASMLRSITPDTPVVSEWHSPKSVDTFHSAV